MQSVRKKVCTRSRKMCSVPYCSSYCTKETSLHIFPRDPILCYKWKIILGIAKPISKYMYVCSRHFTKQDFMPITLATVHKRLLKGVVPSQNLPESWNYGIFKDGKVPSQNLPERSNYGIFKDDKEQVIILMC